MRQTLLKVLSVFIAFFGFLLINSFVLNAHASADTLGYTSAGASTDWGDSNEINGSKFTMGTTAGTVTSMSVYVANLSSTPNNQFQLGIYSDSNNRPGNLIASSATGTLT